MGNPLLCDDGVGLYIAAELKNRLHRKDVTIVETGSAGLNLLDPLVGFDRAIIIDAIQTADGRAGQIYRLDPQAFDTARHTTSPHSISFTTALDFGRKLGLPLPKEIIIFAIEAQDVTTFSEGCTPAVKQAIPTCIQMILQELNNTST